MNPPVQKPDPSNAEKIENEYWLLIPGKPASSRARTKGAKARLTRHKNIVKSTATQIFNRPIHGGVKIYLYHFHKGHVIDLDNMEKPILDGLTGIAYQDDIQVEEKETKRVNLNASAMISGVTSSLIPKAFADNKDCVVIGIKPAN